MYSGLLLVVTAEQYCHEQFIYNYYICITLQLLHYIYNYYGHLHSST